MNKRALIKTVLLLNIPLVAIVVFLVYAIAISASWMPSTKASMLILVLDLFAITISWIFVKKMYLVINTIANNMQTISDGLGKDNLHVKQNIFFDSKQINRLFDAIKSRLNGLVIVIENIVNGNYNENLFLENNHDLIVDKLQLLQQTLEEDKALLEKTKLEEEQRNWMATGLAKFSEILRQEVSNIEQMAYNIISNLVDYVEINQGGLFILNEDNKNNIYYELIAAVAYDRQKLLNKKVNIGEALVGRCAFEKKTIYMTNIPKDYVNITSGLGQSNPSNLLIVPCMIEDRVIGIIELASFQTIDNHQLKFIEKLGESIASSIYAVRNNEKTAALLKDSQSQSDELVAHEEELRQNLEEMETTQEDLRRQMEINANMRKELLFEKYLFDTLLSNIPARINFKDTDRKYIRASKSFLERFGKASNAEIEGKTDYDFFDHDFAEKTMADELDIMNAKKGRINFIEHEVKTNGEEIWKNVSKIPLLDENNNCVGIFASVYDITDFKLAELENKKLKKELANKK